MEGLSNQIVELNLGNFVTKLTFVSGAGNGERIDKVTPSNVQKKKKSPKSPEFVLDFGMTYTYFQIYNNFLSNTVPTNY